MFGAPNISASWDLPDEDRAAILSQQAFLPSDLVPPSDALGDAQWQAAVDADFMHNGEDAYMDYQRQWDWDMTPAQRADALASVALERNMNALVDRVAAVGAKPPVDPDEFASQIAAARMERARRI